MSYIVFARCCRDRVERSPARSACGCGGSLTSRLAKSRLPSILSSILDAIRTSFSLRVFAVVATLTGWLVLSNHCALGAMGARPLMRQAHACCHNGTSQPEKAPGDKKGETECCKSLHAVAAGPAKTADLPSPVLAALVSWLSIDPPTPQVFTIAFGDTGPPRALSFSELVLHRSLQSLAPPALV